VVVADSVTHVSVADQTLSPEHIDIVEMSRDSPQSVAELAAELDLPVGVVRVLIGDLLHAALVRVSRPVPPAELPDERILREVINGLRAL
jgi:transcription antitermination factor NusA-like protein